MKEFNIPNFDLSFPDKTMIYVLLTYFQSLDYEKWRGMYSCYFERHERYF